MLQKLFDKVPNITPERSVFGGFSNGAHTTSLFIAGQDEFILRHFHAFYLVEGGLGPLETNVLQKPSLRHYRFLVLRRDQPDDDQPRSKSMREHWTVLARAVEREAAEHSLDFTSIVMHGYGHEFPPKYMAIVGQWIRGEKLPNTEKNYLSITAVRFRNPVNIGDFQGRSAGMVVEVEKEPVKWAFSRRA